MSEKILTKEIAEQFLILERSVDLDEFSILDDNASAVLSTYSGDALSFEGLTELSETSAGNLSRYAGDLSLGSAYPIGSLGQIPLGVAECLSNFKGENLYLSLSEICDKAAASLSKYEGCLDLSGLTTISDSAAESLSRNKKALYLDGLTMLSDYAADVFSSMKGKLFFGTWNRPGALTSLSEQAVESLSKYTGEYLSLNGLTSLGDAAAKSLSKIDEDKLWLSDEIKAQVAKYR